MKTMWVIAVTAALAALSGFSRYAVVNAAYDDNHQWLSIDQTAPHYAADAAVAPTAEMANGPYEGAIPQAAIYIPEPATLIILGVGSLTLRRRRK